MIEAVNLSKSFENIKALDSINACIKESSVFGLIGTNGAGKSTFLKILAGILKPDSGSIKVDGESVYENIITKEKLFYFGRSIFLFEYYRQGADKVLFINIQRIRYKKIRKYLKRTGS